ACGAGASREAAQVDENTAAVTGTSGGAAPGIVVLGAGGQLGTALMAELADHTAPVVALGRAELDLTASDEPCATALRGAIEQAEGPAAVVPDAVVSGRESARLDPRDVAVPYAVVCLEKQNHKAKPQSWAYER